MADQRTTEEVIRFHGHMCGGLAVGIRAAEVAISELGHEGDDLVAAAETDTCSVDAIQYLTGCTLGKGNLILRDHGKNAYTFWRGGRAVRLVLRPAAGSGNADRWELLAQVQTGAATPEEQADFFRMQAEWSAEILGAPAESLFDIAEVDEPPPSRPVVVPPGICEGCGEAAMANRMHERAGRNLCARCAAATA